MRVSYFSWLRGKTGVAAEAVDLPGDARTVDDLIRHLSQRHPALAEIAGAQGSLRYTVNRRYVDASHELTSSDDVGFFPPVTGG